MMLPKALTLNALILAKLLNEISPLVDVCISDVNQPLFYEADLMNPMQYRIDHTIK